MTRIVIRLVPPILCSQPFHSASISSRSTQYSTARYFIARKSRDLLGLFVGCQLTCQIESRPDCRALVLQPLQPLRLLAAGEETWEIGRKQGFEVRGYGDKPVNNSDIDEARQQNGPGTQIWEPCVLRRDAMVGQETQAGTKAGNHQRYTHR